MDTGVVQNSDSVTLGRTRKKFFHLLRQFALRGLSQTRTPAHNFACLTSRCHADNSQMAPVHNSRFVQWWDSVSSLLLLSLKIFVSGERAQLVGLSIPRCSIAKASYAHHCTNPYVMHKRGKIFPDGASVIKVRFQRASTKFQNLDSTRGHGRCSK